MTSLARLQVNLSATMRAQLSAIAPHSSSGLRPIRFSSRLTCSRPGLCIPLIEPRGGPSLREAGHSVSTSHPGPATSTNRAPPRLPPHFRGPAQREAGNVAKERAGDTSAARHCIQLESPDGNVHSQLAFGHQYAVLTIYVCVECAHLPYCTSSIQTLYWCLSMQAW